MTTEDDQPVRYVVFPHSSPSRWLAGHATSWQRARELGAKKLNVAPEQVWAVAVYDGETDEDAVERGVKALDKKGGG